MATKRKASGEEKGPGRTRAGSGGAKTAQPGGGRSGRATSRRTDKKPARGTARPAASAPVSTTRRRAKQDADRRADGRAPSALRPVRIVRSVLRQADGSALVRFGETQVLCAATVDDHVPPFLRGKGQGWVTAEYGMLPASVRERAPRRQVNGRTLEIQRLIGRSLRAVVDLPRLGERTVTIDCDVLDADGGTRTAAITGAFVALREALDRLRETGRLEESPIQDSVAAVSIGWFGDGPLLDLCHDEDSRAGVDLNVVATGSGRLVEVQGTAENGTFSEAQLSQMIALGLQGILKLTRLQDRCLASPPRRIRALLANRG